MSFVKVETFPRVVRPDAEILFAHRGMQMKYKVALRKSEEGYSVSVPGLPGCWSQGRSEEEALANIHDAIREYLEVAADHNPINAYTMGGIVRDAGLTIEEFRKLL